MHKFVPLASVAIVFAVNACGSAEPALPGGDQSSTGVPVIRAQPDAGTPVQSGSRLRPAACDAPRGPYMKVENGGEFRNLLGGNRDAIYETQAVWVLCDSHTPLTVPSVVSDPSHANSLTAKLVEAPLIQFSSYNWVWPADASFLSKLKSGWPAGEVSGTYAITDAIFMNGDTDGRWQIQITAQNPITPDQVYYQQSIVRFTAEGKALEFATPDGSWARYARVDWWAPVTMYSGPRTLPDGGACSPPSVCYF
jgi:hypothetical protein